MVLHLYYISLKIVFFLGT